MNNTILFMMTFKLVEEVGRQQLDEQHLLRIYQGNELYNERNPQSSIFMIPACLPPALNCVRKMDVKSLPHGPVVNQVQWSRIQNVVNVWHCTQNLGDILFLTSIVCWIARCLNQLQWKGVNYSCPLFLPKETSLEFSLIWCVGPVRFDWLIGREP